MSFEPSFPPSDSQELGGWSVEQFREVASVLRLLVPEITVNSNGIAIRWNNGLQICFHSLDATGFHLSGSSYVTWTYPKAFVSVPIAQGSMQRAANDSVQIFCRQGAINSTTASNWSHSASVATGGSFRLVAIGFWK